MSMMIYEPFLMEESMFTIEDNQLWELKNVMVYRTKIEQGLIDNVCREMEKKIILLGAKRISNPITATYSVEGNIADVEIIIPLDKPLFELGESYIDTFKMENAIKLEYRGNSDNVQKACEELNAYITRKELQPVTPAYNIVKINKDNMDIEIELTVYIGIKKDM